MLHFERNNQHGMSLIQVLVALAIAGVVSSVMISIFMNSLRSSEYINAKYTFMDLMGNVAKVVDQNAYCPKAFNMGSAGSLSPLSMPTGKNTYNIDVIVQKIGGQDLLIAEKNQKIGPNFVIDDMHLEYQKDTHGVPIAVAVDSPATGQMTHHLNLIISASQGTGYGSRQFNNAMNPISMTIVTDKATNGIVSCDGSTSGGAGAVIWSKTITSPQYPLPPIDIPAGTKGIKIDVTSFQEIQLPGDKGRTIGSRFNYTTDGGQSGTFAVSEIGAGNNNGAQARMVATTTGVIPVLAKDTVLRISRQGYLLNENGQPMGTGGIFQGMSITFMGLDKAPESPPPPPPPMGPIGGGRGDGGGRGCFVAGTEIQMADGSFKKIESVRVGDHVLAMDELTQNLISEKITKLHHHRAQDQNIHRFYMADGQVIVANAIHPIFVVEKNAYFQTWQILEMWKAGAAISFQRADGAIIKVADIQTKKEFVPVYNFEVEGLEAQSSAYGAFGLGHNYFADGFLVHNAIYGSVFKTLQMSILGVPSYAMKPAY